MCWSTCRLSSWRRSNGIEVELRHRVIVGKPERETPSVRAPIRALNFFPYWRVPDSVAKLDLIPRLQKEPDYLQKEQIRVLTGSFNGPAIDSSSIDWRQADVNKIKFRQDPGPQNALGLVRLDMPNEHGVYMHDTPMKPLFGQRGRAFSAGCVRVQDVFTLAEWVAKYEAGWDQPGRAQEIIDGGPAGRPRVDAAGAGLLRLHHGLGRARRPRRVPAGHLQPRRPARPDRRPRPRPE